MLIFWCTRAAFDGLGRVEHINIINFFSTWTVRRSWPIRPLIDPKLLVCKWLRYLLPYSFAVEQTFVQLVTKGYSIFVVYDPLTLERRISMLG